MPSPLVIVGPTASGKSALALALAQQWGRTEIVSVDSMQVYRGMDIGTAKPDAVEQALVPHHLIDELDPWQDGSVAWFQQRAAAVLGDIEERGHRAILVGGTGLYHRAVVDQLEVPGQFPEVVADLELEADTALLWRRLSELDPVAASRMEPSNRRRIVRALEVTIGTGRPFSAAGAGLDRYPDRDVPMIGLTLDRAELRARIRRRLDAMIAAGLLDEVRRLVADPRGLSRTARQALGYRELIAHLDGELPLDAAVEVIAVRTRRFAVRQERWFRRDPRIVWFGAESPDLAQQVADTVGPP